MRLFHDPRDSPVAIQGETLSSLLPADCFDIVSAAQFAEREGTREGCLVHVLQKNLAQQSCTFLKNINNIFPMTIFIVTPVVNCLGPTRRATYNVSSRLKPRPEGEVAELLKAQ
jgi:hypothetical protein